MVSDNFKNQISSELRAMEQAVEDARLKREEEQRVRESDTAWFAAHIMPILQQVVAAIQEVDADKRIFSLLVEPTADSPGASVALTVRRGGHQGQYMRAVTCRLTPNEVEVAPVYSSYARPNNQRAHELFPVKRIDRHLFTDRWLTASLETFVMHARQHPDRPI